MAQRRGVGHLVTRPWFLTWLLMVALSLVMALIITQLGNTAMLPAALFYGAAAAPLAFAVATHTRTGAASSVAPHLLLGTFLFGGGVALVLGGTFDQILNLTSGDRILGVGFVEELAKFLPVVVIALAFGYRGKRAGVALGFASAMGFAVLESMSYGLRGGSVTGAELTLIGRGLTEPFGHLAWTGIICAVAFGGWERRNRIGLTLGAVGAYLLAAVLHSINDASLLLAGRIGPIMLAAFVLTAVVSYLCFRFATRSLTLRGSARTAEAAGGVEGAGDSGTPAAAPADGSVPQPRRTGEATRPSPTNRTEG